MLQCADSLGFASVSDRLCYFLDGICLFFFFQAEDGIRDLVRSRGLGDVYKRQVFDVPVSTFYPEPDTDEIVRALDVLHAAGAEAILLSLIHI